jgi:hydrogenase expression/formation protein HypE
MKVGDSASPPTVSDKPATGFGSCPVPIFEHKNIVLGHGSGGKLTAELIEKVFLPAFANPILDKLDDQALLHINGSRLAFTTDSFVVTPIFFPGGDIGTLAINGTVNDLAMCGAKPLYLAAAFILEEGLPADDLRRIVDSMRTAAQAATTTGIGLVEGPVNISADRAQPGDKILVSGYVGDHGMAIMSRRENLEFEGEIESDCAPLNGLVSAMLEAGAGNIHCLRDPTRGGVATTLNEIAVRSKTGMNLVEDTVPIRDSVRGACEILGLDPLYVANEGKLLAVVAADAAEDILHRMRQHPLGKTTAIIGEIVSDHPGMVLMRTAIGGTRVLDLMFGEQLPRIC